MSDLVKVRSLSVFEGSEEKRWIAVGDEWEVTPSRAAELEANKLVERAVVDLPDPEFAPGAGAVEIDPTSDLPATVETQAVDDIADVQGRQPARRQRGTAA